MHHNDGSNEALMLDGNTDILFEMCYLTTNITAVYFHGNAGPKPTEVNLRMSQSNFTLKTTDKNTKIIYFENELQLSWMIWKTEFQINSYHTISSDKNFTNNIDKIITIYPQGPFTGTITVTRYASGNDLK